VLLLDEAHPADPALDLAISHALLRQVAQRSLPALRRVYRPAATVAFGRLDALREGYGAAVAAAAGHGFAPVLRTVGGHAAAYTDRALVVEDIEPHDGLAVDVEGRFERFSQGLSRALAELGVDAHVGEIPGEYCAGRFSVGAGGVKLAGVAQRVISGASLVSAAIVVGDGAVVRAVLVDVYARLALEWDPATAGAVDDLVPGAAVEDVRRVLSSGEPVPLPQATLTLARSLRADPGAPARRSS